MTPSPSGRPSCGSFAFSAIARSRSCGRREPVLAKRAGGPGGVKRRRRIDRDGQVEVVRALHCAIQIADALAAAHREALVHRDVKPENIMVSDGGQARLLDFGVAKDGRALSLTRQGFVVGTSRYMAPEQVGGRADGRADICSLGVVLYEVLAGAHPYAVLDAETDIAETDVQAAHVHLDPTPLPEVLPGCPEAVWRAVAICLAKPAPRPPARVLGVLAQRVAR